MSRLARNLLWTLLAVAFLVAIWVDPAAADETAVRRASRSATRKALGVCVEGRDPAAAQALVDRRDSLRSPFYFGEQDS